MVKAPDKLLFSFIVPIYKAENYLHQCIDSLRSQTYPYVEIILVDDGSPDSCPEICDSYASIDQRIQVVHKENGGVTSARKVGVEMAKGEYICCVDSDDYLALDYIEKMLPVAQKERPDIICCGSYLVKNKKVTSCPLSNLPGYYSKKDIEEKIFPQLIQTSFATYFAPALWGKAFKLDIFKKHQCQIDNNIKVGEDGACTIPCVYEARSMYILPECLYYYRDNPTSVTKARNVYRWDGPQLIAEHLNNQLDLQQFDFQEQLYRKTVHELFTVVKSQFNDDKSYDVITDDICKHLQEPLYMEAIEKSHFIGLAGRLAQFVLKHRLFRLIWLFNILTK